MELKPITVTFKNTLEEIALYEIISRHSSKTAFIKDTLIATLLRKNTIQENTPMSKSVAQVDELNEILDL